MFHFRSATEDVSRTPIAVEKSGGENDTPLKTIVQVLLWLPLTFSTLPMFSVCRTHARLVFKVLWTGPQL